MAFRCCPPVRKGRLPPDPARRTTRTLTPREQEIVRAFQDAASQLSDSVDSALIRQLLSAGPAAAVQSLGFGDFVAALDPMVQAITAEVTAGGVLGIADLPSGVRGSWSFDRLDPRAIAWAQTRAGELIREVTDQQRIILRDVVTRSVSNGWTTQQTARDLQQVIGLPQRWATAVQNGYDTEFARLLATGMSESLAEQQAAAFAARKRDSLLRARAENIARTEIMRASNQGRWLSWTQGVEGGYIPPGAKKKWITGPLVVGAGRKQVCEVCLPLREESVLWDQPFSNGQMMPPAHPSCRCTAILVPPSIEELEQLLNGPDATAGTTGDVGEVPSRYGPPPSGTQRFGDITDIQTGQRGRLKDRSDAMHETTRIMDNLHGAPGSMSNVEIKLGGKAEYRGGKFSPASRGPKPKRIKGESFDSYLQRRTEYMRQPLRARIQINDFDIKKQMGDLTHELGHAIDWDGNGLRSRAAWNSQAARGLQAQYKGDWLEHLDDLADEETRLFCELGRQVREAESVKAYLANSDVAYRMYFTSVEEVWARSYAQWVANASGDERLLRAMVQAQSENYQFTDAEFAEIAPIVEAILRVRGLMV